ncbi:MAG: hypothetical protein ACPG49_10765 [Chitinophagales bacterium]
MHKHYNSTISRHKYFFLEKLYNYLLIIVLLLSSLPSLGQVDWDGGGADDNWNTAANWVGDVIPTATDAVRTTSNFNVVIPAGYHAVAQNIIVMHSSNLTVNGELTINNSVGIGILVELSNSSLTNNGIINVSNTGTNGIEVKTTCTNGGTINIENTGTNGLRMGKILDNSGDINIGPNIGIHGIELFGTVNNIITNLPSGQINIMDAGVNDNGIGRQFSGGTFNNQGFLCIEDANVDSDNIHAEVTFNNTGTFNTTGCTTAGGIPANIPTLSEWGLFILALLLMTFGTLYLLKPNQSNFEANTNTIKLRK